MRSGCTLALLFPMLLLGWSSTSGPSAAAIESSTQQPEPSAKQAAATQEAPKEELTGLPRGKKLVLKDGSFQLVRNYEKVGDRVRYFSVERDDWEVIPASMVDWDATKKAEAAQQKKSAALLEKVQIQEAASRAEAPVDVDASLLVAPGVFLPDGEGMFVFEGKTVRRLTEVGAEEKTDKLTALKRVLSPLPIIPSKHNIEIPGARAKLRLTSPVPEFYLRESPENPGQDSGFSRSGRQSDSGPDVALVRAKVKGHKRLLESIRKLFGEEVSDTRNEIVIQRWVVAPNVYRFTLSSALPPGEYALAEILQGGLNLYVWDFGVDATSTTKADLQ
ncbi:MAG: hypothetical protein WCE61_06085 [Candidatus Acidiferrum sp.]